MQSDPRNTTNTRRDLQQSKTTIQLKQNTEQNPQLCQKGENLRQSFRNSRHRHFGPKPKFCLWTGGMPRKSSHNLITQTQTGILWTTTQPPTLHGEKHKRGCTRTWTHLGLRTLFKPVMCYVLLQFHLRNRQKTKLIL